MKNLFYLLLIFGKLQAATYYVAANGNDGNNGTSEATAWKTIGKVNSTFASLQPGDKVLFKRGDTFLGSILIGRSGTPGSPIYIGDYSTGAKPIITGLQTFNSWTSVGGGIFETAVPALPTRLNIVMLNDAPQPIGRYPNTGYLTITSHGTNTITSTQLPSSPNWTGAELALRSVRWKIERWNITAHFNQTLTYSNNYSQDGYGFFIQNDIKTLDKLGEWVYRNGKLSMYFGSTTQPVQASTVNNLVSSSGRSWITIENISFRGANEMACNISGGSNFTIRNCETNFSGIDGIRGSGTTLFNVENCIVNNSYNNGIAAVFSASVNPTFRNNTINNTYYIAGMGQPGEVQGAGILINGGGIAEFNTILNSGYIGIRMDGNGTIVRNNHINTFGFVKDDAAGVYTFVGKPYFVVTTPRKIQNNVIMNGIGAPAGTNSTGRPVEGIYLDDNANHVEVTGNTASNTNRGIYVHNAQDVTINGNTMYNNFTAQLYLNQDGLGEPIRRVSVTNNIFFSRPDGQPAALFISNAADINQWGSFNNNYYCRPINEAGLIGYKPNISKAIYVSLAQWKSVYGYDAASKPTFKTVTNLNEIAFFQNTAGALTSAALGTNTYVDVAGTAFKNPTLSIQPYTSKILLLTTGVPQEPGGPPDNPPPTNVPPAIRVKTKYKIINKQNP